MKISFDATEIVEASVSGIAMVKRGANRLPIRLIKEDNEEMIDLAKIGKEMFVKSETVTSSVIGVILSKSADSVAMSTILKAAGIDIDKFVKADGEVSVTLTKSDNKTKEDNTLIVKMSDDVYLAVSGTTEFVKSMSMYDWESTSFSDMMQKGSFVPSLYTAQDMLQQTFSNIMQKAEDPKGLSTMIGKAIDDFKTYTTTLAKGLPATVFKADSAISKAAKPNAKGMAEDASEDASGKKVKKEEISANPAINQPGRITGAGGKLDIAGGPASGDIEGNSVEEKNRDAINSVDGSSQGKKTVNVGGNVSNDIEGNSVERAGDMMKNAGDELIGKKGTAGDRELKAGDTTSGTGAQQGVDPNNVVKYVMDALGPLLKSVTDSVTAIGTEVAGLKTQVKKTDEAINGTAVGDSTADKTGIVKREEENEGDSIPLLDTAFMKVEDVDKKYRASKGSRH